MTTGKRGRVAILSPGNTTCPPLQVFMIRGRNQAMGGLSRSYRSYLFIVINSTIVCSCLLGHVPAWNWKPRTSPLAGSRHQVRALLRQPQLKLPGHSLQHGVQLGLRCSPRLDLTCQIPRQKTRVIRLGAAIVHYNCSTSCDNLTMIA